MFVKVALTFLAIAAVVAQYEFSMSGSRNLPNYIKKSLREKNHYKAVPRERKRTLSNLTLQEVFDKIKDITRALNLHAKRNGYFVDYKFRMLGTT
ncbi:jg19908 [Pararge aegeria aegeria]|uniref:Jg19908 protein n=1 Tax=Pararge aegeria aegeria TaxID=348720 RepID=A0A8S4SJR1_9NEOP|nr:jg19908 [Pararge aegeria aegeria]